MSRPFCAWGNHNVDSIYVTNESVTVGFCAACAAQAMHKIQYTNFRKEHPHRFPEEERRVRPMPNPFEKPKMEEFRHDMENS